MPALRAGGLQDPLPYTGGFVEVSPSRALRDGEGIFSQIEWLIGTKACVKRAPML
jgi:hypothetical protein